MVALAKPPGKLKHIWGETTASPPSSATAPAASWTKTKDCGDEVAGGSHLKKITTVNSFHRDEAVLVQTNTTQPAYAKVKLKHVCADHTKNNNCPQESSLQRVGYNPALAKNKNTNGPTEKSYKAQLKFASNEAKSPTTVNVDTEIVKLKNTSANDYKTGVQIWAQDKHRSHTAEKELTELQTLGLAKVVASKGFESKWLSDKKKEDIDLEALKGLGLTSAKTKPTKEPPVGAHDPLPPPANISKPSMMEHKSNSAEKELGELRALGLTKAISSRGLQRDVPGQKTSDNNELEALRGLGLASKKNYFSKERVAVLDQSPPPANINEPFTIKQKSKSAEKELGELQALGLAKAISSRDLERDLSPLKTADDNELKALRGCGLASKKNYFSKEPVAVLDQSVNEPSTIKGKSKSAEKPGQLRTLGLTKTRRLERDSHSNKQMDDKEELEVLQGCGLASKKIDPSKEAEVSLDPPPSPGDIAEAPTTNGNHCPAQPITESPLAIERSKVKAGLGNLRTLRAAKAKSTGVSVNAQKKGELGHRSADAIKGRNELPLETTAPGNIKKIDDIIDSPPAGGSMDDLLVDDEEDIIYDDLGEVVGNAVTVPLSKRRPEEEREQGIQQPSTVEDSIIDKEVLPETTQTQSTPKSEETTKELLPVIATSTPKSNKETTEELLLKIAQNDATGEEAANMELLTETPTSTPKSYKGAKEELLPEIAQSVAKSKEAARTELLPKIASSTPKSNEESKEVLPELVTSTPKSKEETTESYPGIVQNTPKSEEATKRFLLPDLAENTPKIEEKEEAKEVLPERPMVQSAPKIEEVTKESQPEIADSTPTSKEANKELLPEPAESSTPPTKGETKELLPGTAQSTPERDPNYIPETKAERRCKRREKKQKFKGVKRFLFKMRGGRSEA